MITKRDLLKLKRLENASAKASAAVFAFKCEISARCDHPQEARKPYQWELDNGYGRQIQMTGQICTICGRKDLWMNGQFNSQRGVWP